MHAHEQVEDPACGMKTNQPDKWLSHIHGEKAFYFCSEHCKQAFINTPDKYLPTEGRGGVSGRKCTCPMPPEILQGGPGACPKCGMALEPRTVSAEEKEENAEAKTAMVVVLDGKPAGLLARGRPHQGHHAGGHFAIARRRRRDCHAHRRRPQRRPSAGAVPSGHRHGHGYGRGHELLLSLHDRQRPTAARGATIMKASAGGSTLVQGEHRSALLTANSRLADGRCNGETGAGSGDMLT